nr:TonB-dependent receptor [uncultured Roseateles sp.]
MKTLILGGALGLASAIHPLTAIAQAVAPADAPQASATQLDKVVVTAQRRKEGAQDVGIALSVLNGQELTERGVLNVNDLQKHTPSLEAEPAFGGGQPQFRLRGVGFSDYASNNTSTVGIYIDEVALPFAIQTQGLLFDLARVEVLRGPQGTLYGRNSTGGAVNFITNRPTADTHAGLSLEYGSHGALSAQGFVSGALSSELRGRLSVATAQGGAWQFNRLTGDKLGDKDQLALRGQLEWDATRSLNLLLAVHSASDKSDGQGLYLFAPFASGGGAGPSLPADTSRRATGWGLRPEFAQQIGLSADAKPQRDNLNQGASLTAKLDLGATELSSITAYSRLRRKELGDWDASQFAESDEFFNSRVKVVSQELRLASTGNQAFEWVAGAYFSKEKLDEQFFSDFSHVPGIGASALTRYRQQAQASALFGQGSWRLSPQLKLIAGLRYEHEKRELRGLTTGFISPPFAFVPPTDRDLSSKEPSGKLALEYQQTRDLLFYGSLSRGVKSGGFTAYNTTNVAQLAAFQPEVLWAYEAGFKSEPTRSLRINGAVFHYDYRNQQVLSTVYDPVSKGPIGRIANAPKSKIDGFELELQWQPSTGLEIAQYLGYKKGSYTQFSSVDAQASIAAGKEVSKDFAGTSLSFPKLSYGGAVAYQWLAGGYKLRAEGHYSYRDKLEATRLIFTPEYDVASYWLADASLSLTPASSPWTVTLWGRNLFNQKYDQTRNFFIDAKVAASGQPATFGVRLNYAL